MRRRLETKVGQQTVTEARRRRAARGRMRTKAGQTPGGEKTRREVGRTPEGEKTQREVGRKRTVGEELLQKEAGRRRYPGEGTARREAVRKTLVRTLRTPTTVGKVGQLGREGVGKGPNTPPRRDAHARDASPQPTITRGEIAHPAPEARPGDTVRRAHTITSRTTTGRRKEPPTRHARLGGLIGSTDDRHHGVPPTRRRCRHVSRGVVARPGHWWSL